MLQYTLLHAFREAIAQERRILAALTYGSLTQGEADEYSDIEFYLYCDEPQAFDLLEFLSRVSPVHLLTRNEFGTWNALFDGLIRGEFHVEHPCTIREIANWPERRVDSERMLIKDPHGELRRSLNELQARALKAPHPGAELQVLWDRFLNWMVFGSAVLLRGERARAHELLWFAQGVLVRLARLHEGALQHWLSEKRLLESELSSASLARYAACTAGLPDLERAYFEAWTWGRELLTALHGVAAVQVREAVVKSLDERLSAWRH